MVVVFTETARLRYQPNSPDSVRQLNNIPIKNDDNRNNRTSRHRTTPKPDNDIASHNLKRHESSLEDEEVPAGSDTKGIIHEASSKADKGR